MGYNPHSLISLSISSRERQQPFPVAFLTQNHPTTSFKMSKKIGEYSEGHLLGVAKDVVLKKTKDSTILDVKAEDRIPKFELKGEKRL